MSEQLALAPEYNEFERICAHWQADHPAYLAMLRAHAVAFAREHGEVTIDNLRERMTNYNIPFPAQIGLDTRIFGSVLRGCPELHIVTFRRTSRDEWAKRVGTARNLVAVYRLRGDA